MARSCLHRRAACTAQTIPKKTLGEAAGNDVPDSECSAPDRQRAPTRVTFTPKHAPRVTFSVRGRVVELVNDDAEEQAVPR